MRITSESDVRAVLATASFEVPPVPAATPPVPGVGWLRANVSRFSNGAVHRRRRSQATAALAQITPVALGRRATEQTARLLIGTGSGPVDLVATVARVVPVEVLAAALGLPAGLAGRVAAVARGYLPPAEPDPAADLAVGELVAACGGEADERTAARIGLLVQAAAATGGLVGSTLAAWLGSRSAGPVAAVIDETLRWDPPVRTTRRVGTAPARVGALEVPAGTVVELDLAAASRVAGPGAHLAFGHGPRSCPGREHALAIAAGVLEAARGYRVVSDRLPHELMVTPR